MSINFKNNCYFQCNHQTEDEVKDAIRNVKTFKYGNVAYKEFKTTYNKDGWFGRKIIALPRALWSLIVKTIYNVFGILFTAMFNKEADLKLYSYHIARDLQEGFGWLLTIINDTWGAYHRQESLFHQQCYKMREHVEKIENHPIILANIVQNNAAIANAQQELAQAQQNLAQALGNLPEESVENNTIPKTTVEEIDEEHEQTTEKTEQNEPANQIDVVFETTNEILKQKLKLNSSCMALTSRILKKEMNYTEVSNAIIELEQSYSEIEALLVKMRQLGKNDPCPHLDPLAKINQLKNLYMNMQNFVPKVEIIE